MQRRDSVQQVMGSTLLPFSAEMENPEDFLLSMQ
jgi:hypothetical protein